MSERAQALEAALRECFETIAGWRIATMGAHQAHVGQFGTDHLARIAAVLAGEAPAGGVSPQPDKGMAGIDWDYERSRCWSQPAPALEPTQERAGYNAAEVMLDPPPFPTLSPVGPRPDTHPHEFIEVIVCRQCLRTEADIDGTCHHCDEGDGARCWWCLRLKSPAPVSPVEPTRKAKPICPNCGSTDVGEDGHETNSPAGWQGTGDLVCGACEHVWTPDLLSVEPAPPTPAPCVWRENEDGLWDTSCGREWEFIDDGPKENRVKFCIECGQPVQSVPLTVER